MKPWQRDFGIVFLMTLAAIVIGAFLIRDQASLDQYVGWVLRFGLVLFIFRTVSRIRKAKRWRPESIAAPETARDDQPTKTVARSLDDNEQQRTPQAPPPAPSPPSSSSTSVENELRSLAALKADGIISEEEFAAKKRAILGL
jgi:Short C-terminal domain